MVSYTAGPVLGVESLLAIAPQTPGHRLAPASSSLPAGFPSSVNTGSTWTGERFENDDSYIYKLTKEDIAEAESALDHFKGVCFATQHKADG
jgi:hypothetical protein